MNRRFDLVIIGAGVIGSAIARELSRYRLKVEMCIRDRLYIDWVNSER